MHDGMPYGRIQGQGQGHSREVDRQSPTGLIFQCFQFWCDTDCPQPQFFDFIWSRKPFCTFWTNFVCLGSKPTIGQFLNENVQLQNFNANHPTAVTSALSAHVQSLANTLPTSHVHSALVTAASVMHSQYISTLHSRAPVFPPHLIGERHIPWNFSNSSVTASVDQLKPLTRTDIEPHPLTVIHRRVSSRVHMHSRRTLRMFTTYLELLHIHSLLPLLLTHNMVYL